MSRAEKIPEIPPNVLNKIHEYLEGEDRLVTVMCFLTNFDNKSVIRYTQALKSVIDNDKAFEKLIDKLADGKDETEEPLFKDINNKIEQYLQDSPEKLEAVFDQETEIINRNNQILKAVYNDDEAFQRMVDKIAEDSKDPLCHDINDIHVGVSNHSIVTDSELTQNILNQIAEYLKHLPDKLVSVLCFFSDHEVEITKWYYQVLDALKGNNEAFQGVVENLVEDTERLTTNPSHLSNMADTWNYHLKTILLNMSYTTMATAAYNVIGTLSRLPPNVQIEVIQLTMTCAGSLIAFPLTTNALNQGFNGLLAVTTSQYGSYVSGGLLAVYLTYEAWTNLKKWWKGEISGKRCAKNIIDSCAGAAGGIAGGMAGASIGASAAIGIGSVFGTVVAPGVVGIGSIIGAVVVGIVGSTLATNLSDWLTRYFFKLPQNVALENAYRFLELKCGASDEEINASFARKSSEYIPEEGKDNENWYKLQYYMSVIKLSKGES